MAFSKILWTFVIFLLYFRKLSFAKLINTPITGFSVTLEDSLTELPRNVIQLASSVASEYPRNCLRVGVGVDWSDQAHVTLQDTKLGRETIQQFKETTMGISMMNCMMILLDHPPSAELITTLTPRGTTERFFIIICESMTELQSVLLDTRLRDEEHIVGIILQGDTWDVYTRKLYTPHGQVEIVQATSWKPGELISYKRYLYPEQMKNFYGTKFHATTLDFRPFSDYTINKGR